MNHARPALDLLRSLYPRWEPSDEQLQVFAEQLDPMARRRGALLLEAIKSCYAHKSSARSPNLGEIRSRMRDLEHGAARGEEYRSPDGVSQVSDDDVRRNQESMRSRLIALAAHDPATLDAAARAALVAADAAMTPEARAFLESDDLRDWRRAPFFAVVFVCAVLDGVPGPAYLIHGRLSRWDLATETGRNGHWRELVALAADYGEIHPGEASTLLAAAGKHERATMILYHVAGLPRERRRDEMRRLMVADDEVLGAAGVRIDPSTAGTEASS